MSQQKQPKTLPHRSEIPLEYTWKLEDIFASDELWEEEFQKVKSLLSKVDSFKGTLAKSAAHLLAAFRFRDELFMRLERLYSYAHMRYDQDTTHSFYQGLYDRIKGLYTQATGAFAFFVPEILSIPEDRLNEFLSENNELAVYRQALKEINEKRPHVLSEREEAILAKAADALTATRTTFGMLNNADLQFPSILDEEGNEVQVTHGRYISLMESRDRRVRHDAFKAVYQTYQSFRNTFASTLSGIVKRNNFYAQVRGYRSARHAALSDNHIPEAVYDQLVQTVNEHLPLLHRYVAIRKKALGLDELHIYDLFPPLVKDVDTKVTYDKAREILLKAMKPLGDEYISVLREAFQNRWVDVYENKGKRSGAYSSGSYLTSPYILLNWQDKLNDLFTLAHEFGHSVHSYFTRKNQPYIYGDYSIFVAEVASTCNENLLQDYLLKNTADKNMRLYLINHYLDSFRATVYRQTMFAEFEQIIHEMAQNGEPLTAETFTSVYYDLNKKYFGDGMTVDPEIGFEWARIPHFYYNFYVYQYATGFSAATALSKQILQEGAPAVKRYLDFLKAGSSDTPIEVLKKAGVDMTSPEPIRQAFSVFKEKLDELEQLLFG